MYFIVFPIKDGDIPASYVIIYQRVEKELSEMEHPGWNMIPFQSDLLMVIWWELRLYWLFMMIIVCMIDDCWTLFITLRNVCHARRWWWRCFELRHRVNRLGAAKRVSWVAQNVRALDDMLEMTHVT